MSQAGRHAAIVKEIARDLHFDFCGIARAEFLEDEAPRFEAWLKKGYHGAMGYLEKNFDKRMDPRQLVPGARSVISLGCNYFPPQEVRGPLKIARYAYGEDYHRVVKDKLFAFVDRLREAVGDVQGRVFTDSAPVHERAWAQRAGNGWVGKNTLLLNRQMGSFFFLAELIVDIELTPDGPIGDYCGTCTACQDACPTGAITQPYEVDGSRCISYLTIELKDAIPDRFAGQMEGWIFGCDICQEVCPWNRIASPHQEPRFLPSDNMRTLAGSGWRELTEEIFSEVFGKSAVTRAGFSGLQRNIRFAEGEFENVKI
jgi:epoxyqueuosine reductase